MDPITIGLAAVGFGLQLFGGQQSAEIAHQQAEVSGKIAGEEQKINEQKRIQQQLENRRMQLQTIRNAQRQRAQGIAAAVNQGASGGSGLGGAIAQNTNEGIFNLQGLNQASEISGNIFGINNTISGYKQQLAQLGGDAAEAQGLASLGGSLIKIAPTAGAFGKDAGAFFKNNFPGTGFAGPYV
jgi:hypothetical protein